MKKLNRKATSMYSRLTPLQRIALAIAVVIAFVITVLVLVYNVQILGFLTPYAKKWRDIPAGWLILWFLFIVVSFPPLIGYSTLLTIAGIVYGFPNGWFIAATATVVGSTLSFLVSRHILKRYAERLAARDNRFAAFALTIKHDGLKLLVMIRLCPLPYSLSNGALATVPTINWPTFSLASALASVKLMLHVFVGAKLGEIGEKGGDMDLKTRLISYASIAIGVIVGVITAAVMYRQTNARAKQLQALEREAAVRGSLDEAIREYADDPSALEAGQVLRDQEDDISLHPAYADYDEDSAAYRDALDDDGLPLAPPEVFSDGDGSDGDEGAVQRGR